MSSSSVRLDRVTDPAPVGAGVVNLLSIEVFAERGEGLLGSIVRQAIQTYSKLMALVIGNRTISPGSLNPALRKARTSSSLQLCDRLCAFLHNECRLAVPLLSRLFCMGTTELRPARLELLFQCSSRWLHQG